MGCGGSKAAKPVDSGTKTEQASRIQSLCKNHEARNATGDGQKPQASGVFDECPAADSAKPALGTTSCEGNSVTSASRLTTCSMQSRGQLRKQGTVCTEKYELDTMVIKFSSHESTVGSKIGRNCKEVQWSVMFDRDADPIDIKLQVQEHKLHSTEVSIESNGQAIFHGAGSHAKSKMTADFNHTWPLRATIRGINEVNFFEVHPPHLHPEAWFPATIKSQREDGFFEVVAQETDSLGRTIDRRYPAIQRTDLREAASGKPLFVPEDILVLDVPKDDPLNAVLSVNREPVTHHFGRPTPPRGTTKRQLACKVNKDRSLVTADVGHSLLKRFANETVQGVRNETQKWRHSWTFELGPFAEHTVEVTKKSSLGKIVTLLVDGEVLVEASAADIGCQGSEWQCDFQFVGERDLDFEVYKTNKDGTALDDTDHVKETRKYVHACTVVVPNDRDFQSAQLFIDGTLYRDLDMQTHGHEEPSLSVDPIAFTRTYGFAVPYKADPNAPGNMMLLANSVLGNTGGNKKTTEGFFGHCCQPSSGVDNEIERV